MSDNKNALNVYLRDLYNIPVLTREEEYELADQIQNKRSKKALDKLVKHNLRIVVWLAKRESSWENSRVPIEDVIAMGNEWLLYAARRWRPNGKAGFIAFAKPFIRLGIKRDVAKTENIVALPIGITEKIRKMQYYERVLTQKLGRAPTMDEVIKETGFTKKRIDTLKSILLREPVSLDAIISQNVTEDDHDD